MKLSKNGTNHVPLKKDRGGSKHDVCLHWQTMEIKTILRSKPFLKDILTSKLYFNKNNINPPPSPTLKILITQMSNIFLFIICMFNLFIP